MITQLSTLSSVTARQILDAAIAEANRLEISVAICVADVQGNVLSAIRMDGVTPPILGFAEDKAYTAATMRRTTVGFAERMASSPSLSMGLSTRKRLLPWGGGLPIVHAGKVVGGLGVSGAKDAEDILCAEAALNALGLGWGV